MHHVTAHASVSIGRAQLHRAHGAAAIALVLALACAWPVQARVFQCSAGDVPCLTAAIVQANNASGKDNLILLQAGTYALTTVDNDTDGPNGLPSITGTVKIRGAGAAVTHIVHELGPIPAPFRLLHVAATGSLTLEGLSVEKGFAFLDAGGGIFNNGGSLMITNGTLANNHASVSGGGIYSNGGSVTITNSAIANNEAERAGGGIFNSGGSLMLNTSTLSSNSSEDSGGGIYNKSGNLWIMFSTISSNNSSINGGGITNSGGTLNLTDSFVVSNIANDSGSAGGGIFNTDNGTLTMRHSTVAGNQANNGGGRHRRFHHDDYQ
jgi:hypothetical protein